MPYNHKKYMKKYHQEHKKQEREYHKKYRKEHVKYHKEYGKKYRQTHKEYYKEYGKQYARKKRLNPKFRLNQTISVGISSSLATGKNGRHWETLVNYTLEDLKIHLEFQFQEGMTWDNYGKYGWHIDHIKPISSFHFESFDDPEFKQCWDLDNLQPLWAKDNWRKSNLISMLT